MGPLEPVEVLARSRAVGTADGPPRFTEEQLRRYSQQMVLDDVGGAGQARLLRSRVLVVGAGGLGSPAALYLAGAGVGTIGLVDSDSVEVSNLQRQILHDVTALGHAKVDSGLARLEALNPEVRVVAHRLRLDHGNVRELLSGYDVVVEGTDNQPTKFLVNDAAVALGTPLVVAGILRWEGQLLVVRPRETACYRCVYRGTLARDAMPSCETAGIVGPVAGVMGSLQAVEALKLCLGLPTPAAGHLLLYDGATGEIVRLRARRDPTCAACGTPSHAGPGEARHRSDG
jgi:adenylyltransferase/sulfurtransferase